MHKGPMLHLNDWPVWAINIAGRQRICRWQKPGFFVKSVGYIKLYLSRWRVTQLSLVEFHEKWCPESHLPSHGITFSISIFQCVSLSLLNHPGIQVLLSIMATSELRFLRNLKPGIPLFLRINKPGGSWRRLEGISEPYFSKDVGNRVDEEFGKHKEQIENKYGRAIGKAIIEWV